MSKTKKNPSSKPKLESSRVRTRPPSPKLILQAIDGFSRELNDRSHNIDQIQIIICGMYEILRETFELDIGVADNYEDKILLGIISDLEFITERLRDEAYKVCAMVGDLNIDMVAEFVESYAPKAKSERA